MADDYEVGYGKPPKHTRFRKGQSGHPGAGPRARPTSDRNEAPARRQDQDQGQWRRSDGAERSRALCLALIQKAMGGDVRAFSKIVEIIGPEMADELKAAASLTSADVDIVRRALARAGRQTPAAPLPQQSKTLKGERSHELSRHLHPPSWAPPSACCGIS